MAATDAAERLTEAHRLAQVNIGRATVAQLLAVWPLLDVDRLDNTTARWLLAAIPIVLAARRLSALMAVTYIGAFRTLELGVDAPPFTAVPAGPPDQAALIRSLTITGPIAVKVSLGRGEVASDALDVGAARSAGAGMRIALNGGRQTVTDTAAADPQALGYARATSGHACAFCAMLAARGPVYRAETVDFQAHDHCSCSGEPVYRRDAQWPAGGRQYQQVWNQAKTSAAGQDVEPAVAFRRLIEGRA